MALHVFVFLLVVCLLLSLALLWRHDWLHLRPSSSRGGAKRSTLHRLLKPRCPDDCPACRLASALSSGAGPASAHVRPWREVKSRRGAPKRIPTEGFACPNHQCPYFGVTDAHIHALVGDGKHGQAEQIQTFRCQACRTTFSARRHTPLFRLKTPSQQVAMVLTALAEGLDPSAAERVFGFRQATISSWLSRAGKHAQTFHERSFYHLRLPRLQLDELRTRLRSSTHVLWLWLTIDPLCWLLPSKVARNRCYYTKNALSCSSLPRRGIPLGTSVRKTGGKYGEKKSYFLSRAYFSERMSQVASTGMERVLGRVGDRAKY